MGAVGDSDPFASFTRVDISGEVKPGSTYTFNFTLTAPGTPGGLHDGLADGARRLRMVRRDAQQDRQRRAQRRHSAADRLRRTCEVTGGHNQQLSLAWDASTDNYGVLGYRVYRNGAQVGTPTATNLHGLRSGPTTRLHLPGRCLRRRAQLLGKERAVSGTTVAAVFQDGFANLNNWTLERSCRKHRANVFDGPEPWRHIGRGLGLLARRRGTLGVPRFSSSLSAGGYKTGTLTGWLNDVSGASQGCESA